jgi:FkbM family methyltransferase
MTYYSQLGQDEWVRSVLGDRQNGYFVELGACDGIYLSNTLFFERHLNWNGICIEPNDTYFKSLQSNRKCHVSNDLIYSDDNKMVDFAVSRESSSIIDDHIGPFTCRCTAVKKHTVTLGKVLDHFDAPRVIDYLSLDVEGQEYNILRTFPFDKYQFKCITVEHNAPHIGTGQQTLIREILERNGYKFIKGNDDVRNWKHGPIDDFYVKNSKSF